MASLFEVNENGEIVYEQNEGVVDGSASPEEVLMDEGAADPGTSPEKIEVIVDGSASPEEVLMDEGDLDPETSPEENEVLIDGIDIDKIIDSGIDVSNEIQNTQMDSPEKEIGETSSGGDEYNISLLSDEIQELLVNALSPASGSLGSSTIDYFDRVVSGLPSDYKYIAYRTDNDDSYDGVLYFGDDYEIDGNIITFGEHTTQLRVVRESSGGYNQVTNYYESSADGASISYDLNGSTVYYTNAEVGYPLMGGYEKPFDYSPLIAVGLLCVMALAILQKIFLKR